MPKIKGISHIELTVSDSARAAEWWQEVMGFTLVHHFHGQGFEGRNLIHPSGIGVAVMTHDGTAEAGAFDERRVGLDHLSFEVSDRDELEQWTAHLSAKGVPNTGIIDAEFGPTVVLRDPDNMQLEFFVHPTGDTSEQLTEAMSEDVKQAVRDARQAQQ